MTAFTTVVTWTIMKNTVFWLILDQLTSTVFLFVVLSTSIFLFHYAVVDVLKFAQFCFDFFTLFGIAQQQRWRQVNLHLTHMCTVWRYTAPATKASWFSLLPLNISHILDRFLSWLDEFRKIDCAKNVQQCLQLPGLLNVETVDRFGA